MLKNDNEFAVKLKRWRQYYRQRDLVDVLEVPANSRINLQFTGGDRFEIIRQDTGELVGILRPNVKYKDRKGNEVTYME